MTVFVSYSFFMMFTAVLKDITIEIIVSLMNFSQLNLKILKYYYYLFIYLLIIIIIIIMIIFSSILNFLLFVFYFLTEQFPCLLKFLV